MAKLNKTQIENLWAIRSGDQWYRDTADDDVLGCPIAWVSDVEEASCFGSRYAATKYMKDHKVGGCVYHISKETRWRW
jgi:hypothetical protein